MQIVTAFGTRQYQRILGIFRLLEPVEFRQGRRHQFCRLTQGQLHFAAECFKAGGFVFFELIRALQIPAFGKLAEIQSDRCQKGV